MDLKSPSTLVAAWLLFPLLVTAASLALGLGVARIAGIRLGAMTLPAGYLTGIALMGFLLLVGVSGKLTVWICAACAVAGGAAALTRVAGRRLPAAGREIGWTAGAGLAAFAVAILPLAGTGRAGILGYVFNNDPAEHISLVEILHSHGASQLAQTDSFSRVSDLITGGYPLGSYGWPLFARTIAAADPFEIWTPLIALTAGMLALVVLDLLRSAEVPPPVAAPGAAVVAVGHLVFAYEAQGSAKELIVPVAVYGTVALALRAQRAGLGFRALVPAVIAAAATVADIGSAGFAWLAPAALVAVVALAIGPGRRTILQSSRAVAGVIVLGLVIALPAIAASIKFYKAFAQDPIAAKEIGNLLGPVSLWQVFNVWLAQDYRFATPDKQTLTDIGIAVAAVLAVAGLAWAVRTRAAGPLLALVAGIAGALVITPRTNAYFDAKTFVALAPAIGTMSVLGAAYAIAGRGALRVAGLFGGVVFALFVLASDAYVYEGVWMTPKGRFEQLDSIGHRFAGQGPLLVSEREQYSIWFLRRERPWDDWGYRQLIDRAHLRFPGPLPPPLPRAPDFDDYPLHHIESFPLLLERKTPGASRPPRNFRIVYETSFYRVWRRIGPAPRDHVPLGTDGLRGSRPLACRAGTPADPRVRRIVGEARTARSPLTVSIGGAAPRTVLPASAWNGLTPGRVTPPPGEVVGRGGQASTVAQLPSGRYRAWVQGAFGPGVRLYSTVQGTSRIVGEVHGDLGSPDGWFDLGEVSSTGNVTLTLIGLTPSRVVAGSRHFNLIGPFVVEPVSPAPRIVSVPAAEAARRLCGQRIDWMEL